MRKFGYLDEGTSLTTSRVEAAIKAFQEVAGVSNDGELGKSTMSSMRKPRCGNTDIKSPKTENKRFKRFSKLCQVYRSSCAHTRNLLSLSAQVGKWLNKMNGNDAVKLKWFIQEYTKDIPRDAIR